MAAYLPAWAAALHQATEGAEVGWDRPRIEADRADGVHALGAIEPFVGGLGDEVGHGLWGYEVEGLFFV